jgi:dGTPase
MLEEIEKKTLSPYATLSSKTKGRQFPEEECDLRPSFQHDRDKILHSKSFRRLKHKTQVFLSPTGDHYRTRLTHTLEVSQIARTVAKALRLNSDLTEAISLGHDLGHTPFGHAGEAVLNKLHPGGFAHNEQSLRVVQVLENEGMGLNLTWEVRDGILHHAQEWEELSARKEEASTLEGRIVKIADSIAFINHDIDDALRAGIIKESDLPRECLQILGNTHSQRINTMVKDVIESSWDKPQIKRGKEVTRATEELRQYLYKNLYSKEEVSKELDKAKKVLKDLYHYFQENPELVLQETKSKKEKFERAICDFIAGMTDRYALTLYKKLFVPREW